MTVQWREPWLVYTSGEKTYIGPVEGQAVAEVIDTRPATVVRLRNLIADREMQPAKWQVDLLWSAAMADARRDEDGLRAALVQELRDVSAAIRAFHIAFHAGVQSPEPRTTACSEATRLLDAAVACMDGRWAEAVDAVRSASRIIESTGEETNE